MGENGRLVHPATGPLEPEPAPRPGQPAVDQSQFRTVMSRFATGVTVLTVGGEHCHGMTANAFGSVSLSPPLVLCCVARTARMHEAITAQRRFAVSMLGADQEAVARYFTDRRRPQGAVQFDRVDWVAGPYSGAPLLSGSLAWVECALTECYDGGDHSIFLGAVLGCGYGPDRSALLFFGGDFHQVMSQSPAQQPAGAGRPRGETGRCWLA
ncbi:MAG TPA: flavin reductase family protein [Mycobacteriales bacterium]